jgi:hypothetical protein
MHLGGLLEAVSACESCVEAFINMGDDGSWMKGILGRLKFVRTA